MRSCRYRHRHSQTKNTMEFVLIDSSDEDSLEDHEEQMSDQPEDQPEDEAIDEWTNNVGLGNANQ